MKLKRFNENVDSGLSEEEAAQLYGEIDNQGFGYWIQNYGYDGQSDPKLTKLCEEARQKMNELDEYIKDIFNKYDIE